MYDRHVTRTSGRPSRRAILAGLGALALEACERRPPAPARQVAPPWRDEVFAGDGGVHQRALVFTPGGAGEEPLPLVVALHGRGESGRGLEVGARAWRDDYGLEEVERRLRAPPIVAADLGGFTTPDRLGRINASLAAAPYRGIAVACPYAPDLPDKSAAGSAGFARFVIEELLARARGNRAAPPDRRATGIDGVSMGGRLALLVGLGHPEVFGRVGALQPALRVDEARAFAALARDARKRADFALRLVSSEGDPFLPAVRALSARLVDEGVEHDLVVTPGPHDYAWNRGPGAAELLLWHERVARGLAPP